VEPTPVVLSSDVQADKPKVPVFTPPVDFYNNLNAFLVAKFRKLSAMLNEQTERVHNTSSRLESKFRFLYFNHMNLALKTSLNSSTSPLSMEAIKIIRTMHADFATKSFKNKDVSHQDFGPDEVCVKTRNQGWIVGRKATQSHREFFVIVDEGAGNLADIKSEVDELARSYFYNIFIH
jgi:hypothetical protein